MSALRLCAAAVLVVGCSNFPTIDNDVCGNRVIDAQEDCDFFTQNKKQVCRAPGADNACHYDCTAGPDGKRPACPTGWGCNSDSVCRAPTTTFSASLPLDVGAWNLTAGNFDGDGRDDIMSSEPLDSIGATQVRFFYFDQSGGLADIRPFSKLLLSPMVKDISGDGLSDVTFAFGQVSLMLGNKDRSWVPETFSTYRLAHSSMRMISVSTRSIGGAAPIVPLVDLQDSTGFFIGGVGGQLDERAVIGGKVRDLVGDPVSGNLFEDPHSSPCFEPVYALKGAHHFTLLNVCQLDSEGSVAWRDPFVSTDVALDPPADIDGAPQIVDMNGDGHLDVLVGAGGRAYVAYGNGQKLAPAVPYRFLIAEQGDTSTDLPMPLAAGDFSGDGVPDFVFPDHLLISAPAPKSSLPVYSAGERNRLGSPYTAAVIADFNGNGFLDVVAASSGSLDVDFFNGTGTQDVTNTRVPTGNPVHFLTATDLDGDHITDLVLFETAHAGDSKSPLRVAFGAPFAPPTTPVTVAQVAAPEQLMSYAQDGIGAVVVSAQEVVSGVPNGAFTFLDGAGDRIPYAPLSLTDFTATGSIANSLAVAVTAGSFSHHGHADLMALAFSQDLVDATGSSPTQPWLVRNILDTGATSEHLPRDLSEVLNPIQQLKGDFTADITSASADLNADGRDEAIFAMPAGAKQQQCGVVVFAAAHAGESPINALDPVILNEPCAHPQLSAADLDADGNLDLVLLTGETGGGQRKLFVLWNDGAANFDAAAATLVSDTADSPQAFAVLPAVPSRPLSVAYVTSKAVRYVPVVDKKRTFLPAVTVPEAQLSGGTGIAAADVDGDGVTDLVVAESGKLVVLKAQLEAL